MAQRNPLREPPFTLKNVFLPRGCTIDEIRNVFQEFGSLHNEGVRVGMNYGDTHFFVDYQTPEAAIKAFNALNGTKCVFLDPLKKLSLCYTGQTQMKLVALKLLNPQATRIVMPKRMPPGPVGASFKAPPAPALQPKRDFRTDVKSTNLVYQKKLSSNSTMLPENSGSAFNKNVFSKPKNFTKSLPESKSTVNVKSYIQGRNSDSVLEKKEDAKQESDASSVSAGGGSVLNETELFNRKFASTEPHVPESKTYNRVVNVQKVVQTAAEDNNEIHNQYLKILKGKKLLPPSQQYVNSKKMIRRDKDSVADLIIEPTLQVQQQRLLNITQVPSADSLKITVQQQQDLAINSGLFTLLDETFIMNLDTFVNTAVATAPKSLLPRIIPLLPIQENKTLVTFK